MLVILLEIYQQLNVIHHKFLWKCKKWLKAADIEHHYENHLKKKKGIRKVILCHQGSPSDQRNSQNLFTTFYIYFTHGDHSDHSELLSSECEMEERSC